MSCVWVSIGWTDLDPYIGKGETKPKEGSNEKKRTEELEVGVEPLGDAHVHEADLLFDVVCVGFVWWVNRWGSNRGLVGASALEGDGGQVHV